eukprot:1161131-Pelagomonas_calceolata.AAC.8
MSLLQPYFSSSRPGTASSPVYPAHKSSATAAGLKDPAAPHSTRSSSSVFLNHSSSSGGAVGGGGGGNLWLADPTKSAPVSSQEHPRPISASSTLSTTAPATPSPRSPPRQRDALHMWAGGGFLVGREPKRPPTCQHHHPQQQEGARLSEQEVDAATEGSQLEVLAQESGNFCSEWDWATEVEPQLALVAKRLSLQDTMDVIADAYRSKFSLQDIMLVEADAHCSEVRVAA